MSLIFDKNYEATERQNRHLNLRSLTRVYFMDETPVSPK